MLTDLSRDERLHLVKFVCSFAWADLQVRDEERSFVRALIERLGFDGAEREEMLGWLASPPDPEEIDPQTVPPEHRQIFLSTCLELMAADGDLAEEERENFNLLSQLLI